MTTEQQNFAQLQAALEKLFAANTPDESFAIIQEHLELLSEEVDDILEQFIYHAHEQGKEDYAQFFSYYREMLQDIRQTLIETQNDELQAALEKLLTADTPEESFAIIQEHPELLSEEADEILEQFIHDAHEQGEEDDAQFLTDHRYILQDFRQAITEAQDDELQATLEKLFTADTPEESFAIIQEHPELLTEEADKILEQFIHDAHEQGKEDYAQAFRHHREMLQSIRQTFIEAQYFELKAALEKLLTANTPQESFAIIEEHPELLTEEADKILEQLIHHAREQSNEQLVQWFSAHREMLQKIRRGIT